MRPGSLGSVINVVFVVALDVQKMDAVPLLQGQNYSRHIDFKVQQNCINFMTCATWNIGNAIADFGSFTALYWS